jgi:peptidoglycan/xylan/chitin deacetylase (PgdA/CDA1 family)
VVMDQPSRGSITRELQLTPVLAYHSVRTGDTSGRYALSPRRLDEQLAELRTAGFEFVTFSSAAGALAAGARGRLACLTFDDGYADFAAEALPVLRRHRAAATVFVTSGLAGDWSRWLAAADQLPLMSWAALRDVAAEGVEIGSHGHTHAPLDTADDATLQREIAGSRHIIEDQLGCGVSVFAYPYGYRTRRAEAAVSAAGYRAACVVADLVASPHDSPLRLPRLLATTTLTAATVETELWRARRAAYRAWRTGIQSGWTFIRKVLPVGPRQGPEQQDPEQEVAGQ